MVLGTMQDGGSPHLGCGRSCCIGLSPEEKSLRMVACLGISDPAAGRSWLLEATPDIATQVSMLNTASGFPAGRLPDGILLTHAHIGHYSGLLFLGREAAGADSMPVYVMPRLFAMLTTNEPWKRLVVQGHVRLAPMTGEVTVPISGIITVTPYYVPHRDELSETVCFIVSGPGKKALFLPDIDKWDRWDKAIDSLVRQVDYAFLDATFSDGDELKTRDLSLIPHPFVVESMARLDALPAAERAKVVFIHFNHTNPLANPGSEFDTMVRSRGFRVARTGDRFPL